MGWLHNVSIAFYCCIYSAKQAEIDIIIHECVPNFDPSILEQCLCPDYTVSSLVWSAADEGLPIRRERRYSLCIRKSLGRSLLSFNHLIWSSLIFCNRVVTASIFFRHRYITLNLSDMICVIGKDFLELGFGPLVNPESGHGRF